MNRFRHVFLAALLAFGCATGGAQTATLYTKPVAGATGALTGTVSEPLTHAVALHRDRAQCFRAELSGEGRDFKFTGLPTGKYDLLLITKSGVAYEGLALGENAEQIAGTSQTNLETRIAKSDTFFNKSKLHRLGLIDGGEQCLAFIERTRDKTILKQSGEPLKANLRRFEVAEFTRAQDDWTLVETRHLYREEAPLGEGKAFFRHRHLAEIGNLRIIDSPKNLGSLTLPPP